ncbi:uncharacterized protein O3C94_011968 [Discoglossus pictus]
MERSEIIHFKNSSTPKSSVHLLGPSKFLNHSHTVHLACVVRAARQIVHVVWNISGTHHKGRTIAMEEPNGTWTFLNQITVPITSWQQDERLACQVWFNSSPVVVHRNKGLFSSVDQKGFANQCTYFLISIPIGSFVLLVSLSFHLFWIFKRPERNRDDMQDRATDTQDGIVYAVLNHNASNTNRK